MPDFHLAITIKAGLLILAFASAVALSFWVYRYTIPPISRRLRFVLIALRSASLFLIFFLLGEPLLSLLVRSTEEPRLEILVDNSRSMAIRDRQGDRSRVLANILSSSAISSLGSIGKPHYTLFDATQKPLSQFSRDSLTFAGDGTDIGSALKSLRGAAAAQNTQAVLLLTDGNVTSGMSPLYEADELGLPVFTIGIGDSTEQKDLLVRKVQTNDITYVGSRVPVTATIKSAGYGGERIEATLRDDRTVLDRKILELGAGTREYSIPFSFVPQKEGTQKFTVDLSHLAGELTDRNNSLSFFTKVLKSKMRVLLVAGSPSQDAAFIRRALEGDKNIEVKALLGRTGGEFQGGPLTPQLVSDADCVVLIGFPDAATSPSSLSIIRDALNDSKPFLFVLSRTMDFQKLRSLESSLPFLIGQTTINEYQAFLAIAEPQLNNPIFKLTKGSADGWSRISPLFKLQAMFRAKPESEILGTSRIQSVASPDPFLVSRNVNRKKSVAVLGYGLWRWKMFADPASGTEDLLDEFLSNTVRWLTTREDDRRVKIRAVKSAFNGQEPVEFSGQVYDANYQPIDDATVQVRIAHGTQAATLTLGSIGNGQYSGFLDRLDEGDYAFSATAELSGRVLGEDNGTVSVGGLNVEFLDSRMNKLLLQQMAIRTGGRYYDVDRIEDLPKDIAALPNFKTRELTHATEIELWNFQWTLALIVLLLALEWFLRKRNGMV